MSQSPYHKHTDSTSASASSSASSSHASSPTHSHKHSYSASQSSTSVAPPPNNNNTYVVVTHVPPMPSSPHAAPPPLPQTMNHNSEGIPSPLHHQPHPHNHSHFQYSSSSHLMKVVPLPPVAVIRLKGVGTRMTVGGLYSAYDESYPSQLQNIMSERDFSHRIVRINDDLSNATPCLSCQVAQYLCCPCTLGASILCVRYMCGDVARQSLRNNLQHANWTEKPQEKRVKWSFQETMCENWIQLEIFES